MSKEDQFSAHNFKVIGSADKALVAGLTSKGHSHHKEGEKHTLAIIGSEDITKEFVIGELSNGVDLLFFKATPQQIPSSPHISAITHYGGEDSKFFKKTHRDSKPVLEAVPAPHAHAEHLIGRVTSHIGTLKAQLHPAKYDTLPQDPPYGTLWSRTITPVYFDNLGGDNSGTMNVTIQTEVYYENGSGRSDYIVVTRVITGTANSRLGDADRQYCALVFNLNSGVPNQLNAEQVSPVARSGGTIVETLYKSMWFDINGTSTNWNYSIQKTVPIGDDWDASNDSGNQNVLTSLNPLKFDTYSCFGSKFTNYKNIKSTSFENGALYSSVPGDTNWTLEVWGSVGNYYNNDNYHDYEYLQLEKVFDFIPSKIVSKTPSK